MTVSLTGQFQSLRFITLNQLLPNLEPFLDRIINTLLHDRNRITEDALTNSMMLKLFW